MLKFRQFIVEYLTDKQRSRYAHIQMDPKARQDTDHFFGSGNDVVHGSLHSMTDKSEIHRKIENHLGKEISHDDYRAGMTTDHLNRPTRIGKLIKDPQLRDEYARDPTREGSRSAQAQYTTSTVRGTEVAGQSNPASNQQHPKGHSWANISCKNNVTGINRHYLDDEIKHGTVAHFVHDRNGQEIYRATLQPHHNERGHVAYAVDAEYGIKHPSFTEDAHRVAKQLSHPTDTDGVFEKHKKVYHDSNENYMLHPNVTSQQLHSYLSGEVPGGFGKIVMGADGTPAADNEYLKKKLALKHPDINSSHLQTVMDNLPDGASSPIGNAVAKHPKLDDEQIHQLIDKHPLLYHSVASNPSLKDEHAERLIMSRDYRIRGRLVSNPAVSTHIIASAASDPSPSVRARAHSNPKMPLEHLLLGLKDEHEEVRSAATSNRKVSGHLLTTALQDPKPNVRRAVFQNPNVTSEHISMAMHDSDRDVKEAAAGHKNATSDHLHQFLDDDNPTTRMGSIRGVVANPNAKIEHLQKAFERGNSDIRYNVTNHPNMSGDLIHRAFNDPEEIVRHNALKHPNVTTEHLHAAANHAYDDMMREYAKRILEVRE